jgi:autotransporter strand-loop-strand O-heptosyltransferase
MTLSDEGMTTDTSIFTELPSVTRGSNPASGHATAASPVEDTENLVASEPNVASVADGDAKDAASADGSGAAVESAGKIGRPGFPKPPDDPLLAGPEGMRFDFNDGCRVLLPERDSPWTVRLRDLDTGNIIFETTVAAGRINSSKRYYVRFRIEVWKGEARLLSHDYDAAGQKVLIQFPVGTLGDTIGWLPYAVKFQKLHRCRLTCCMADKLIPLFEKAYPDITFVGPKSVGEYDFYATYNLGLFFDDEKKIHQPCDFRQVGLHRTAGYILGVDPTEQPPRIVIDNPSRPIAEPYVVIATQSSTQAKYWNNPTGWHEVIDFLKESGYRVICIDQKRVHGQGLVWNHLPNGAEDQTGDRPLSERARWLAHADFFVGLASGLSWLAWCAGTPVVMVSGFSHPTTEFATPYRVINYHACNSCWEDPKVRFDHFDFLWCPRHKNTPRHFECTRLITATQVKVTIERIPQFQWQRDRQRGYSITRSTAFVPETAREPTQ